MEGGPGSRPCLKKIETCSFSGSCSRGTMHPILLRFLRQVLLNRYKTLLDTLRTKASLSDDVVKKLQERILNIEWLSL